MTSKLLLKIIFSSALLLFVATLVDWGEMSSLIADIHILWWLPAIALMMAQMAALAWRWHIMVNDNSSTISYPTALRITLAGNLANLVVIASVGGILARIALVMRHGMTLARATTAAISDRLITLATLCFLAVIFLPLQPLLLPGNIVSLAEIGVALVLLLLAVLPWLIRYIRSALERSSVAQDILAYFAEIFSSSNRVFQIAVSSLLAQMLYIAAIILITHTAAPDVNLYHLISLLPIIILVASLPISFGGWGVREGSFVFGLALLGISNEVALLVSIQIGFLSMLSAVLAGLPAIFHPDITSVVQLRKAPAE